MRPSVQNPSSQGLGRDCAPCFLGTEGLVGRWAGKDCEVSVTNPEGCWVSTGEIGEKRGSVTAWAPGSPGGGVGVSGQGSGERQWRAGDWSMMTPLEAKMGPVLANILILHPDLRSNSSHDFGSGNLSTTLHWGGAGGELGGCGSPRPQWPCFADIYPFLHGPHLLIFQGSATWPPPLGSPRRAWT